MKTRYYFLLFFVIVNISLYIDKENRDEHQLSTYQQLRQTMMTTKTDDAEPVRIVLTEQTERSTAETIKEWTPFVVYVECSWNEKTASGSGFATSFTDGSIRIVTNKHVLYDDSTPDTCIIRFLNGDRFEITDSFHYLFDKDVANITLNTLSEPLEKQIKEQTRNYCNATPDLGDKVIVLGYPGIGSKYGITVTEGIISGDTEKYYITSAKLEHGNSGGIAISAKNNCIIGIPTAVISGSVESLGLILPSDNIFNN